MSFSSPESNLPGDTFSATGCDVDAAGAEAGETASLPAGTTDEEEVVEGVAPVPNCPARKTWAALASFDLMSCAGAAFCASVDEATGVAADDEVEDGELVVSELPAAGTVGAAPAAIWILTAKLPVQGGAPAVFTPRKRWPGPSALSCLPLPTRTGTPCDCSLAIRAPAGAEITGRPVLGAPATPAGSQVSPEPERICRTSPVCRSTPVSVQGCVVEMVKE